MSAQKTRRRLAGGPLVALAALLAVVLSGSAGAEEQAGERSQHTALRSFFKGLTPLEPITIGPLTVVPLSADPDSPKTEVSGHPTLLRAAVHVADAAEPQMVLENPIDRSVLVTAGRVAYTADAELILAHDVVVPARGQARVRALPGSFDEGQLKRGERLSWYPRWAPPALRERIIADATKYDIKHFLSLFTDVVGAERDRIPSLRDVLGSSFVRALDRKAAQVMHEARFRDESVVGFVSGLHGWPVMLQLFGSPELHRKNAPALLLSHGAHAAAIEARAAALGMRLRKGADASRAVLQATHDLLTTLRIKSHKSTEPHGARTTIEGLGVWGEALWYGDRPVHIAVYPHSPYDFALFARTFRDSPSTVSQKSSSASE